MFKNYIQGTTSESIQEVKVVHTLPFLQRRTQELARKKTNAFFLHGDIPTGWVYKLFECSRIAIVVGMLIRYWSVLEGSDTISVTSMKLKGGQISKNQKSKALRELEDKGLIIVERSPGRNPVVQIQEAYRQDDYYSKRSSITPT